MHSLQPHSAWRTRYIAADDPRSPFFLDQGAPLNGVYHQMYDFVIHPDWDDIGCETLFLKVLFVDYAEGCAVIELLGEWNDALHNDVMEFKRRVADPLLAEGIVRFVLVGDNLLNFHAEDPDYYAEWAEEVEEEGGWIVGLNFRDHVADEVARARLGRYIWSGPRFRATSWRAQDPLTLCQAVEVMVQKRLGM